MTASAGPERSGSAFGVPVPRTTSLSPSVGDSARAVPARSDNPAPRTLRIRIYPPGSPSATMEGGSRRANHSARPSRTRKTPVENGMIPLYRARHHTREAILGRPDLRLLTPRGGKTVGDLNGAARIQHAPAFVSWRSLRPPDPPLGPENETLYFRRPERHPYRRSVADRAASSSGAGHDPRHRRRRRPHPHGRQQASGATADRGSGQALRAILHECALARRHAHQLGDDLQFHPQAEGNGRDSLGRRQGPHQKRTDAIVARERKTRSLARRHSRSRRSSRSSLRHRLKKEAIAVKEAKKLGIPVVAIVDTN